MSKLVDPPKVPLYKLLRDGKSQGSYVWSLPKKAKGEWTPGDWHEITGELEQCRNGLHVTTSPLQRIHHTDANHPEVYEVEVDGHVIHHKGDDEVVARKVRLLRRLDRADLVKLGVLSAIVDASEIGPYYAFLGTRDAYDKLPMPVRRPGGGWRAGGWYKHTGKLTDTTGLVLQHDLSGYDPQPAWRAPRVFLAEARGKVLLPRHEKGIARASEVRLVRPLSWAEMKRLGLGKGRKIVASGDSPVVGVIKYMAASARTSDRRAGRGVEAAIRACVASRMRFALGDFIAIAEAEELADWHGADGIEPMYRWLIASKHESAIRSFEAWLNRKPFIVRGKRLGVGDTFWWARSKRRCDGTMFKVTSFDDEKHVMNACTYRHEQRKDPHRKGAHQYRWLVGRTVHKFTHATIAAAEEARVLEAKRAAETERLQEALRYASDLRVELMREQIHAWTAEQRAAAWTFTKAKRGWDDPPVPVPDFISAAVVEMKRIAERQGLRRKLQERKFKAGGSRKDYVFEVEVSEAEIDAEEKRVATAQGSDAA